MHAGMRQYSNHHISRAERSNHPNPHENFRHRFSAFLLRSSLFRGKALADRFGFGSTLGLQLNALFQPVHGSAAPESSNVAGDQSLYDNFSDDDFFRLC